MSGEEKDKRKRRKKSRSFRLTVFLTIVLFLWSVVAETTLKGLSNQMFDGSTIQYILSHIGDFIVSIVKPTVLAIGSMVSSLQSNSRNLAEFASPIAILGAIPLYSLMKKGTESPGSAGAISILYLFFALLVGQSHFALVYLSIFPTFFLYGLAFYAKKRKLISFIIFLATIFVNPVASIFVLIFALSAFYRNWKNGREAYSVNLGSMILEGVSTFLIIVLSLKYSYKFFLYPQSVVSTGNSNLSSYTVPHIVEISSYVFTNVPLLVPEFTKTANMALAMVVVAITIAIGVIAKVAIAKVGGKRPSTSSEAYSDASTDLDNDN